MSLTKYRQKRRFDQTPEPVGKKRDSRGVLRFVVQKHQASRLHYDFRLELDGTLKSWAIPKGPSLNPDDKRLAMMVEDHPLDYRTFEGAIPPGNYGAGTVMIWDKGTYCHRQTPDRQEGERLLRKGLAEGHLTFVLNGRKLRGEFALIKLKGDQKNAWLLIKKRDPWASSADVTAEDRSVTSGRSLEQMARKPNAVWRSKASARTAGVPEFDLHDAPKGPMPRMVKPMLGTLIDKPFDHADWLFEVKWDGFRAIAEVRRGGVFFYSRNHKSFADRFAPLTEWLHALGHEAVLDGEVVVVDERGRSRFQLLQNYQKTEQGRLIYYAFDLLYLDGRDLRKLPLARRKELLHQLVGTSRDILFSEHMEKDGIAFFKAAEEQGLEGIIAKDGASPYRAGVRSRQWLKIKTRRRQEAVICGFTEPRGARKDLGALVLGVYEGHELTYIGHTGGGFNVKGLSDLRTKLEPLIQRACPFAKRPATNAPVHWVAPRLVCEVAFQEWTEDGIMRMPIFLGLREDKSAHAVHREATKPVAEILHEDRQSMPRRRATTASTRSVAGRQPATGNSIVVPAPVLTNLQKRYWPDEGYTKGDLIAYYREVSSVLLPYLKDRPQSLHRHPNGIAAKSFFQKDVSRQPPPAWVHTIAVASKSEDRPIRYVLCQDEATLLYLANLGCIELNPWNSRVGSLDSPDYLVIDLDPEDTPFPKVVEAAVAVRRALESAGAASVCKTSGKRGLHIFVPLGARYNYDHAKQFAELVATLVNSQLPESTSVVRSPMLRQGRVYLDYLQNRRGQTLAAAYSVRPYPGATVSTPLLWKEVNRRLDPSRFTMLTTPKRIDRVGDLWQPVLGPGIDLTACLERLVKAGTKRIRE